MHATAVAQEQWLATLQVELEQSLRGIQSGRCGRPDSGEAMIRERWHCVAEALCQKELVEAVQPKRYQQCG